MENEKYRKLGGWLAFFIITCSLGLLSSLGMLFPLLSNAIRNHHLLVIFYGVLSSVVLGLHVAAIFSLIVYKKNPRKFLLAEIGIDIVTVITYLLFPFPLSGGALNNFLAILFWPIMWAVYFTRSRRVAVYCSPRTLGYDPARPSSAALAPEAANAVSNASSPDLNALSLLFLQQAEDFKHSHLDTKAEDGQLLHNPVNVLYAAYAFAAVALPLGDQETARKLLQKAPDPQAALSYVDDFVDAYNYSLDAPKENLRSNPFYGCARAAQRRMGVPFDMDFNVEIASSISSCVEQALPLLKAPPAPKKPLNHCMHCGAIIPEGQTHCDTCRKRLGLGRPAPAAYSAPDDEVAAARAKLRYCKYCGLEMGKEVTVCPNCGKRARWFKMPSKVAVLSILLGCSLLLNIFLAVRLASPFSAIPEAQTTVYWSTANSDYHIDPKCLSLGGVSMRREGTLPSSQIGRAVPGHNPCPHCVKIQGAA